MQSAAAYIRVSTDDQTEHSPDSQLKELKEYASRHDLLIDPAHIYIDAGISGRKAAKRPAFQKMIAAAKNRPSPFGVILVWKFSRFARNQEESILYKSLLRRECGIEVVSVTEETGDSMFGSLIERIIEWMDEFYSIRLGEEVRTKMAYVAEKGGQQTVAPFGYRKPPGQPLEIVPDEADWVIFMAENVLAGRSYRWIATQLNDAGVRTHRGGKFEPRTVEYILRNVTNAGAIHWTPDKTAHDRLNPYSDGTIIVEGACPAIYDMDFYKKVLAEVERRAEQNRRHTKPDTVKRHWLSGFLKCSACGASMVYSKKHNGFQCYKYGKGLCTVSHYVSAPKIEAAVIEALGQITIAGEYVQTSSGALRKKAHNYAREIDKLEKMLERARTAYVEGIDTVDEYADNKRRITAEIEKVRQKEAAAAVAPRSASEVQRQIHSVCDLIASDTDDETKRRALGSIVEKIVYSRPADQVDVFLKI